MIQISNTKAKMEAALVGSYLSNGIQALIQSQAAMIFLARDVRFSR